MVDSKPIIAFTAGDPAGIGPEIILKAINRGDLPDIIPLLVGNAEIFEKVSSLMNFGGNFKTLKISSKECREILDEPVIVDPTTICGKDIVPGKVSKQGGKAAYESLICAIDLAKKKKCDAIVTAPLNKESLKLAGVKESGHTEILARQCGADTYAMLYWSRNLSISLVTTHHSLSEVPRLLREENVYNTAKLTCETLAVIKRKRPHIGILGLNPHSGEHGIFGNEEKICIEPAIKKLRDEGFNVEGPIPADTAFISDSLREYDGFVAMYHDQGSIPFKMLHFEEGVNHTMGLPIIRTSVDHGTAFDIAWKGSASCKSLVSACELALILHKNKKDTYYAEH